MSSLQGGHCARVQCLQHRRREGGLQMAAPVLANAYRSLSDGYHAFQACRQAPLITLQSRQWQQLAAQVLARLQRQLSCLSAPSLPLRL